MQIFTTFLNFEGFQLENLLGSIKFLRSCESKFIRMPRLSFTYCNFSGSSKNFYVTQLRLLLFRCCRYKCFSTRSSVFSFYL